MKSRTVIVVIIWTLGFLLAAAGGEEAAGQPEENSKTAQVDALFAYLGDGIKPGAAVLIVKDGEAVYSKGFGYADIERQTPITPEMTFRLASVSKQFTAAAILVLAEQGKLDIDDPLIDYLPAMSAYPGVTIRQLMNHTSGLPDYYDEIEEEGELLTNADVAELLANKTAADFSPGEKYEYSNSAYEMLAQVVEAVSDQTFAEFMDEFVFEPAGMTGALIHDHKEPEIQNRVYGYDDASDGYVLNDASRLNGIVGSGGMYATLNDFFAWDVALNENAVLSADSLAEAYTNSTLSSGEEFDYGLGWGLDEYAGYRRAEHGGSWVGFRTGIARFLGE